MEPVLEIAQVVERTEAEGPGERFAVWVKGCPLRCPGCCNPEMLPFGGGEKVRPDALALRAARANVEGVSLLGGEPFAQAEAAAVFASAARRAGLGVMIYTGFTLAELEARGADERSVGDLLASCDLLVDGRYERDLPETSRRWIGSSNQRMHFLSDRYDATDLTFTAANTVELRLKDGELVVNGWPALAAAALTRKRRWVR